MNVKQSSEPDLLYLWRDDGERFSRNDDGTYTMDQNRKWQPTCYYKYTFKQLMDTGVFSVFPPTEKKFHNNMAKKDRSATC